MPFSSPTGSTFSVRPTRAPSPPALALPTMTLRAFPLLALFCAAVSAVSAASTPSLSWDFGQAFTVDTISEVPETGGGLALVFKIPTRLQSDADEQNKQVLVLDGSQSDSGRTKGDLAPFDNLKIRLRFKPASQGASLQTVVTVSGCYELRYDLGRSRLEFIISKLPEKQYRFIHVPVAADIWNQAEATYQDGKLTLSVGLGRSEDTLPEGIRPSTVSTTVRVGYLNGRPFTGAISSLTVETP